jgi:hypothetical protein
MFSISVGFGCEDCMISFAINSMFVGLCVDVLELSWIRRSLLWIKKLSIEK